MLGGRTAAAPLLQDVRPWRHAVRRPAQGTRRGDRRIQGLRGLREEVARPIQPVVPAACETMISEAHQRPRPVPGEPSLVQETRGATQEDVLRTGCLTRPRLVPSGPPQGREEHAGVDLEAAAAEIAPVDNAGGISEVQDVTEVEAAVDETDRGLDLQGRR